ncbi:MAG: hypothetical protein ABR975_10515 [Vulcanimicrobiaceae bacterium]
MYARGAAFWYLVVLAFAVGTAGCSLSSGGPPSVIGGPAMCTSGCYGTAAPTATPTPSPTPKASPTPTPTPSPG